MPSRKCLFLGVGVGMFSALLAPARGKPGGEPGHDLHGGYR
jgi:hypothetical protein